MYAYETIRKYRDAVSRADLEAVCALFCPEGVVSDPILGESPARMFFSRLFAKRRRAIVRLVNVMDGLDRRLVGLQLQYSWVVAEGATVETDGVVLFEFSADPARLAKVSHIYDASTLMRRLPLSEIEGLAWG